MSGLRSSTLESDFASVFGINVMFHAFIFERRDGSDTLEINVLYNYIRKNKNFLNRTWHTYYQLSTNKCKLRGRPYLWALNSIF
jgi:hypothetical protein